MKKQSTFSIAHLKAHADDLVNAVNGSVNVVVITRGGSPKVVLQDFQSFESLQRAVTILEHLVTQDTATVNGARAEIDSVLKELRAFTR